MESVGLEEASQSPENGSQHCKPGTRLAAELSAIFPASQSPENRSQHCKPEVRSASLGASPGASRNPLKTGLSTASLNSPQAKERAHRQSRNPLKTGLSTASADIAEAIKNIEENSSRNPLKTGLSTASMVGVGGSGLFGRKSVAIP